MYKRTLQRRRPATTAAGPLENFKKWVLTNFPTSLTPDQEAFVENGIEEVFLDRPTPDHPPYHTMITNAIKQLNEEGGSSMVTISKFIQEKHKDLPWHHESLVKHHLGKLCECGDIVKINEKRYSIAKESSCSRLSFRGKGDGKSPKENARGKELRRTEVRSLSWGRGWHLSRRRGRGWGWNWQVGKGQGRGQSRGRSLGWELDNESSKEEEVEVDVSRVEDKMSVHQMEATEKQHVMLEEEADEKGLKDNARRVKLHRKCKELGGLGQGRGRGQIRSLGRGKDSGRGPSRGWELDNDSPKEEEIEVCDGLVQDKVSVDHMKATEKHVTVAEEADTTGGKENARRKELHRIEVESLVDQGWGRVQSRSLCKRKSRSLVWSLDNESLEGKEAEVCVGQVENKVSVDHIEATEKQYLTAEEETYEKVQSKEQYQVQGSEDSLNVRGEIEPQEQERRVNEESCTSQQENELVKADDSSIHTATSQQKEETGKNIERLMEAAEVGAPGVENQPETQEQSQLEEDPISVFLENYLKDDNMLLVEEGEEPQPSFAGIGGGFVEADGVHDIFSDWSIDDTTAFQELSTTDIRLWPEWFTNDTPALPDLPADNTHLLPDLSIDDIPFI